MSRPGELRHINKLRYWPLESVLHDKYLFPKADADALAAFLGPMLRLNPDKRAKAADLAQHVWLEGVVVQGEIDVIRRLELEDGRRRTEEQGRRLAREAKQEEERRRSRSGGSVKGKTSENVESRREREALEQSERDAMKPVDESVLINGDDADDDEEYDEQQQAPPHQSQQKVYVPPILNAAPQPATAQKTDRSASGGGSGIARALNANATAKQSPAKKTMNGSRSGKR